MRKEVSGMWWMRIALVGAALVASGCAAVGSGSLQEKCSDNVTGTVERFLMGVTEMNLGMIRSVVPDGISPLAIFGNGDASHGRKIVGGIIDHPEIHRGNEVNSNYLAHEVFDTEKEDTKQIQVERRDQILLMRNGGDATQTLEQHSHRMFTVTFDSRKNCILAVNAIDPEWIRIP